MPHENANTSELHFQMAQSMFKMGNVQQALHYISSALETHSHHDPLWLSEAIFLRGMIKYALGDIHGAIADYSQKIQTSPDARKAYHDRAIAYLRIGKKENALSDLHKEQELGGIVDDEYFEACRDLPAE